MASRLMLVEGEVQRSAEGVVHLMATRIIDRTDELDKLSEDKRMPVSLSPADIFKHPLYPRGQGHPRNVRRSEEHTSELQSLMRISYAVFCLKKKNNQKI